MAGSSGDLDIKVTCDVSEVATAMTETRSQLDQTITTIQVQDQSWRSMSVSVIGSAASIAGPVISLIAAQKKLAAATLAASTATAAATVPTITLAGAMALLASPAVIVSAAIVAVGAGLYYFTGESEEATKSTDKLKGKLEETGSSFDAFMATASAFQSGLINDETALNLEKIKKERDKVSESLGKTVEIVSAPFIDGAYAVGTYAANLLGIESASSLAVKATQSLGEGVNWLNTQATNAIDSLEAMAYAYGSGASEEAAKAFVAEGHAIKDLAKANDARIARLESEKEARKQFNDMIEQSAATAARAADAERIRSTYTIEGIEKEIQLLKERAIAEVAAEDAAIAALRKKGASKKEIEEQEKKAEESARNRGELVGKAVTQKRGIETGEIVSPVQTAINSSRMELLKLTEGEDAAAIAAARLAAKTDDERAKVEASIPAFLAAREAVREASKAKEEQKHIADLLKRSAEEEAATQKRAADQIAALSDKINVLNGSATSADVAMRQLSAQGFNAEAATQISGLNAELERLSQAKSATDKVTSLKDQIDILTGAATSAEVAMRELGRAGFTSDQVAEIGALTEQLDALRESQKKQPKGKAEKDDSPTVALQGSKEAAEIMLRGVGGGSKLERLGESQLATLQRIATAVSAKPATQQPPTNPQPQQQQPQMVAKPAPFALPPAPVFSTPVIPPLPEQPEPLNAQPAAIARRPIPIQSPLVARSVLQTPVAAQIPTPQVVEPQPQPQPQPVVQEKTHAEKLAAFRAKQSQLDEAATQARWNVPVWKTATGMLGGALLGHPIDGARNADSQDPAVDKAEAAAESHLNNWNRKQGEYAPPQESQLAVQPTQVPSVLPSSGPVEPAVRPVGVPDAIPSGAEVRNFTIADVPVTQPLPNAPRNVQQQAIATPQPALPSMPNWEQHALAVQQSLVSGLSDGPRLSAADDNVPIDQAAFPETSFKPQLKPIDVSTPAVAAIDIPSPVVNAPEQSQIAIPSPIVNPPTMPQLSVAAPEIQTEAPSPVAIPQPDVSAPQQSRFAIPEPFVTVPTMSPIAMESPTVIPPQTPSIAIPSLNVTAPNASRVDIPQPIVGAPEQSRIAIPDPLVDPINVTSPAVSVPAISPINLAQPSVNVPATPNIAIAAPNISTPKLPAVSIPSPAIQTPTVEPISIAAPEVNQAQAPAVSAVDIPSPMVNVAQPVAVASPTVPPINVPSQSVNLANTPPIDIAPPEVSIAPLPLRPIILDAPEVSIAGLSPITTPARQEQPTPQPTINTVSKPSIVPTVAAPTFAQTPVPNIPELTIPTPKIPSLSIPELPRAKPPSLEKFSGMSTRVEASLRSGPSNEASNLRNLEKLAASQLLELKNNTAAVKANKPQQIAAGSV